MTIELATKHGQPVSDERADEPIVRVPWELDGPHFAAGAPSSAWATRFALFCLFLVGLALAGYLLN